jgi:hypothetical protein
MAANKDLKTNNMDAPPHKEIYEQGYEMRKKVVGEEYVERSLKAAGSDFMRPLQQFATVCLFACIYCVLSCFYSILLSELCMALDSLLLLDGGSFDWDVLSSS